MRIAYENQIDALASTAITALTQESLYGATRVQDERLTVRWRTTAVTNQTILLNAGGTVTEGETWQPMFAATTNLVVSPEDFSFGAIGVWAYSSVGITTAESVLGVPSWDVRSNRDDITTYIASNSDLGFAATAAAVSIVARRAGATGFCVTIEDWDDSYAERMKVVGSFVAKDIAYPTGSEAMPPVWIDDETVRISAIPDLSSLVPGNDNRFKMYPSGGNGLCTTADSVIYSAPIINDGAYPHAYTATSRAAWATAGAVAFQLPPGGKFIVDCEFRPYFGANQGHSDCVIWEWYAGGLCGDGDAIYQ